jgi:hypothetical protein
MDRVEHEEKKGDERRGAREKKEMRRAV